MLNPTFITGNPNKAREISAILGFTVEPHKADIPEIQSFHLEEIVRAKVEAAQKLVGGAVIVEDVSFELAALNGFPGPFIKFWSERGNHDLDELIAKALGNDRVTARSGVGFCDGSQTIYVEGVVEGRVVSRRGEEGSGWGFDYYFIPDGYDQTFAEMGMEAKLKISHRARGFGLMKEKLETL